MADLTLFKFRATGPETWGWSLQASRDGTPRVWRKGGCVGVRGVSLRASAAIRAKSRVRALATRGPRHGDGEGHSEGILGKLGVTRARAN